MELKDDLRLRIEKTLVPLISGHDRHICLLDVADYFNVGDHMITLGQLEFIKENFPSSRISFFDFFTYSSDADRLIDECSIILLQGGGNFGDLWPQHQDFREKILKRFAHKRIIQLPQSIRFSSSEAMAKAAVAIAGAADFHFMVRDYPSQTFARANFDCPVHLIPDMAFCLPTLRRRPPVTQVMCLLRSDKEAVANHDAITAIVSEHTSNHAVDDWTWGVTTFAMRLDRLFAEITRQSPRLTWALGRSMLSARRAFAQSRLEAGINMVSAGQVLVTDRLHGHVLACLLGIPHFFFNSADGKVAALYEAWTHREKLATLVDTPEQLGPLLVKKLK